MEETSKAPPGFTVQLANAGAFEEWFLAAVDFSAKYDELHEYYALGVVFRGPGKIDWAKLNNAVIDKFSKTALKKVKERAWKAIQKGGPA